jgi:hypothetical protein
MVDVILASALVNVGRTILLFFLLYFVYKTANIYSTVASV